MIEFVTRPVRQPAAIVATMSFSISWTMSRSGHIERVEPTAGISGGEVAVVYGELSSDLAKRISVKFAEQPAHLVAAMQRRTLVTVPELDHGGETMVSISVGET